MQFRLLDRKRRRHLLLGGKRGDRLGDGDGEEGIGQERCGLGRKLLEDGEPFLHPGFLLPEAAEDGMDRECLRGSEIVEETKLLAERGAPGRVIEPEAVELGFGARPGFLDDPRLLFTPGLQGEEPLEAIDEEESATVLDDDEGVITIGFGGHRLGQEEFGGDGDERDFADVAHGRLPGIGFAAGGRERI